VAALGGRGVGLISAVVAAIVATMVAVTAVVATRAIVAARAVVVVVIRVFLLALLLLVGGVLEGDAMEAPELGALLGAVALGVVGVGLRVDLPGWGILGGFFLLAGGEVLRGLLGVIGATEERVIRVLVLR